MPITDDQLWGGPSSIEKMEELNLLWRRKTHRELNAVDLEYILAFQEAGISLQAIKEGIIKSLAGWRPKFPGDAVRSVNYCSAEIYAAGQKESEGKR